MISKPSAAALRATARRGLARRGGFVIPPRSSLWPVVVLVFLAGCGGPGEGGAGDGEMEPAAPGEDFLATLCFPGTLGSLRCDRRPIRAEDSAEKTAAAIVEALIAGPRGVETADPIPVPANVDDDGGRPVPIDGLFPALPAGVRLLAVELIDGVAYVDLTTVEVGSATGAAGAAGRSALLLERPPMGLTGELLAVYSLVNSLTANNLGVDRVVLMWNGEQRPTFAGHVDTTRPLMADRSRNAGTAGGV